MKVDLLCWPDLADGLDFPVVWLLEGRSSVLFSELKVSRIFGWRTPTCGRLLEQMWADDQTVFQQDCQADGRLRGGSV